MWDNISTKVAIVKGTDPSEMIQNALQLFDNYQGKISGKNVVIKPNLGAWSTILPKIANENVVTNKDVLLATIALVKELGASSVTIAEGAFVDLEMDPIYKDMGLKKDLKDQNVELVDLAKGPFRKVELDDKLSVEISELILDADCLINMPMLKTHGQTIVSIAMKNLKGALSHQSKRTFHRNDLEKMIAHLTSVIKPTFNIVDGIVGLEGFGPVQTGTPIKVGVIIVGDNLVATDAVASSIMGFNPQEIPHIKMANDLGNGPIELSEINFTGESVENVKVPFEPAPTGFAIYEHACGLIRIPEGQIHGHYTNHWCSMCTMNFVGSLWALRDDCGNNYKQKIFVVSDQADLPEQYEGQLILYGNCQARNKSKLKDNEYIFIKGCPPSQLGNYSAFGKALYSKPRFVWGLLKRIFKTLAGSNLSPLEIWKEESPEE